MADNGPVTLLSNYAHSDTPRYWKNRNDLNNGPGGASAANMKASKKNKTSRYQANEDQNARSIDQMKSVIGIYNSATDAVRTERKGLETILNKKQPSV